MNTLSRLRPASATAVVPPHSSRRRLTMQSTVSKMQRRSNDDSGFTMIELLVVVVIIGVLVGIAVPVYLNYRKGAENKSAASDVRGTISAVEQYYTENANTYP